MNNLLETLNHLILPIVEGLGCEFIGCEIQPQGRRRIVRVFIDTPAGVTIDDCERVSRQLSAVFDVEDIMPSGYDLEVSSPGLDRPLFTLAHYRQFLGQKVKVRTHIPHEGRRNFTGILTTADETSITLVDEQGQTWNLPFLDIDKGNIIAAI